MSVVLIEWRKNDSKRSCGWINHRRTRFFQPRAMSDDTSNSILATGSTSSTYLVSSSLQIDLLKMAVEGATIGLFSLWLDMEQ